MNRPLPHDAGGPQLLPGEERRRSQRVIMRMPVTLLVTIAGQELKLEGTTVSVNDHGAMIQCSRTLAPGTKVEIRNDRTSQTIGCKVTRHPVENQDSFLIPMEFSSPAPGFWHISFPPTDWKPLEE